MTRRCAVFDWDDTLHRGITLLPWVRFLSNASALPRSRAVAIESLFERVYKRLLPYEVFAKKVVLEYALSLVDFDVTAFRRLAEQFVEQDRANLFAFARPALELLQRYHLETVIVSGCPQEILNVYRGLLDINRAYGSLVRQRTDGTYSGEVDRNPALAASKEALISELSADCVIVVALGNTPSDWPLLKRAKLPLLLDSSGPGAEPQLADGAQIIRENEVLTTIESFLRATDGGG